MVTDFASGFAVLWAAAGCFLAALTAPRPAFALTILPVFDISITSAANATLLEATINDAIGIIGSLYSNTGVGWHRVQPGGR